MERRERGRERGRGRREYLAGTCSTCPPFAPVLVWARDPWSILKAGAGLLVSDTHAWHLYTEAEA
eukprot:2718903-Rhodomonas_salina.1